MLEGKTVRQLSFAPHSGTDEKAWPADRALSAPLSQSVRQQIARMKELARTRSYRPATVEGLGDAMAAALGNAAAITGEHIDLIELGRRPELLCRACLNAHRRDGRGLLGEKTIHQRIGSGRTFLKLMEREIGTPAEVLLDSFEAELERHFELVGDRLFLPYGHKERR